MITTSGSNNLSEVCNEDAEWCSWGRNSDYKYLLDEIHASEVW